MTEACPECQFIEQVFPPDVYNDVNSDKGLKMLIYKNVE